MTTFAPRDASSSAVAAPMPLEAPVMRATLPARGVVEAMLGVDMVAREVELIVHEAL
jgi:hypothetical protein